VTDVAFFRDVYAPLLRAGAALESHLAEHHAETAAFIVEPLVSRSAKVTPIASW